MSRWTWSRKWDHGAAPSCWPSRATRISSRDWRMAEPSHACSDMRTCPTRWNWNGWWRNCDARNRSRRRLHELPELSQAHRDLGAVLGLELAAQIAHMQLDRDFLQIERAGNLLVRGALDQHGGHLEFARRQDFRAHDLQPLDRAGRPHQ